MAYTPLRISIPEPCHEDWDRMTPVDTYRRHCGSCDKHVTDFSWMTDREIHRYLAVAGTNLCGRFRADQLDRPIRAYVAPNTGWRAAAAAAGLLMSAGAAGQAVPDAPQTNAEVPYTELSTLINAGVEKEHRMKGTFSGRVLDADGEPLIGATILIKGTQTGTVADFDGNFSLTVKAGQQLQISFVGYHPHVITVLPDDPGYGNGKPDYILHMDETLLEEVVVVGGAVTFQGRMTGAVSTIEIIQCFDKFDRPDYDSTRCVPSPASPPAVTVFPNPFADRLNLALDADRPGTISAQLWNVQGQLVREWPAQAHEAGRARIELPLGDLHLVPGHYILRYTDQDGKVESEVVMHQ